MSADYYRPKPDLPPHRQRKRFRPVPSTVPISADSYPDICEWMMRVRRHRGHPDPFLRLTVMECAVAETTLAMVLQEHRQPSRAEIAAQVRDRNLTCCEKTVERSHNRLRSFGYLDWCHEYEIGKRYFQRVRVPQAWQMPNVYTFHLPAAAIPTPSRRMQEALRRSHTIPRPKTAAEYDRQSVGVAVQIASVLKEDTLAAPPNVLNVDRQQRLYDKWRAERAQRQAEINLQAIRSMRKQE